MDLLMNHSAFQVEMLLMGEIEDLVLIQLAQDLTQDLEEGHKEVVEVETEDLEDPVTMDKVMEQDLETTEAIMELEEIKEDLLQTEELIPAEEIMDL